jgi:hypothetical protein
VSAMRPGWAKIIDKVRISWYFESPEADHYIAENACWIDYADTWSSKQVHSPSKCNSLYYGTWNYGCEDTLGLYTGVTQAGLPITGIHSWVASTSKIHWIHATVTFTTWMHDSEVCPGSIKAIVTSDPVDVEKAYSHIASCYHSVQWPVRSHGWSEASYC